MITTGNLFVHGGEIASLINKYNRLPNLVDKNTLIKSGALYFPVCLNGRVIANVAVARLNYFVCEIKHLVVTPEMRGHRIGEMLVKAAVDNIAGSYIVASVRADNVGSLKVFQKHGFQVLCKSQVKDHETILLGRAK
jgi:N-acetylglutamate synthase-like GNAT family acetyltransferase